MCKKTEYICSQHTFLIDHLDRAKAAAQALVRSSRPRRQENGKDAGEILARMPTDDSKGKASPHRSPPLILPRRPEDFGEH
jgi:hypothetical protein